jgi:YD repeat-containing protein
MTYPNGVIAQYTYYADNRLHTLANKLGNTYLSTFNYAYDGNGNMLTKLELKGTTAYIYDELSRLKKVTEPDGKVTQYTFDAVGNRLTEAVAINNSDTTTVYDYNNQGRLVSSTETSDGSEKTTDFYYDNNGSQISMLVSTISSSTGDEELWLTQPGTSTEDETTFEISEYDVFRRLVSVLTDNCIAEYKYNADGLRTLKDVKKNNVTTSTRFLYEGGYITLELNSTGTQVAYNIYGNEGIISRTTA